MKIQEWQDIVEANTPEGFPHLVYGWPDEEHGLTWDAYVDACKEKVDGASDNLDKGADMPPMTFPTFSEWKETQRGLDPERNNLGFDHSTCDLCFSFPGDRHAVTALPVDPAENKDYVALSVCGDCICYIANGDVPDWLENP